MNMRVLFHVVVALFFVFVGGTHVIRLENGTGNAWDFFMALVCAVGIVFALESAEEAWK